MKKKRLPKSLRKFIRQEKARLKREISDLSEQQKLINELYERVGLKKEISNTRSSRGPEDKSLGQKSQ